MNAYHLCASMFLPAEVRNWARGKAYQQDEFPDSSLPQSGCAIAAVLTRDIPPHIREMLEDHLRKPAKVRVETSDAEFWAAVNLARPEYRRHLRSILVINARAGDALAPAISSLRKHCGHWF